MINLLDDFHNILTVRQPSNLKLSIATHMTSSLLDIHPTVPAINLPSSRNQHSSVSVKLPNGVNQNMQRWHCGGPHSSVTQGEPEKDKCSFYGNIGKTTVPDQFQGCAKSA